MEIQSNTWPYDITAIEWGHNCIKMGLFVPIIVKAKLYGRIIRMNVPGDTQLKSSTDTK